MIKGDANCINTTYNNYLSVFICGTIEWNFVTETFHSDVLGNGTP